MIEAAFWMWEAIFFLLSLAVLVVCCVCCINGAMRFFSAVKEDVYSDQSDQSDSDID